MIPINRNGDCASDLIGSGTRSCDLGEFGDVIGFFLHPKSFSLNVTTDVITEASWKELIKDSQVIPYTGIYDFVQNTPENEVATSSTGIESTIRLGKPSLGFNFDKGSCIHKSLFDKRGKNRWDITLVFETGMLLAQSVDGTKIEGFDMGRFDIATLRLQQGTDPQQTQSMLQLVNAVQFNAYHTFITWEELGVDLSQIDGVVQTAINYVTTPVAGDTSVVVKLASACNLDDPILGADAATDWAITGTQSETSEITSVTYDAAEQNYTVTFTGALVDGNTFAVKLSNTEAGNVFEDDMGNMFKGQARLITIAEATT